MRIDLSIERYEYWADLDNSYDLSIPLDFDGSQPNHFAAAAASLKAFEVTGFTGRTRTGASCNVDELTLIPHCNGTHTETLGHLLHDATTAADVDLPALIPAALITITPTSHHETPTTLHLTPRILSSLKNSCRKHSTLRIGQATRH